MIDLCKLIWWAFAALLWSRAALDAEILVLRHQLNVLHRKSPGRLAFSSIDRLVFAGMYTLVPNVLNALKIANRKPCSVCIVHAPVPRAVQACGHILVTPVLGGLHHHYERT